MKILIRADSSGQIGLGHVMRTLVLATQYPDNTVMYACQDLPGNIMDRIPYEIHVLNSNDSKELIALIHQQKINMVIFDSYDIHLDYERAIKEQTGIRIMSLDDTYEPHHCDILLNHNISGNCDRYEGLVPPHCELRCGSAYTLIRDEFKEEKKISREKVYDIVIAMGGADTTNVTTKILQTLDTSLNICIITTTANAHLSELLADTIEYDTVEVHVNSDNVAKLLNQSRFAIITPSVMVHEVLFMEIPFVAIKTADNQSEMANYLDLNHYSIMHYFDPQLLEEKLP